MDQAQQIVKEEKRLDGKIVRLNKGFGFIEGIDGRDYFFHWSELTKFSKQFRNLQPGDQVQFQPGRTDTGLRAFAVETVDL
jgi:cold shock CspA family protein